MSDIYKVIKALPPLPKTVSAFEKAFKDEESTIEDFVKIIYEDPMLTADILKAANSTIYGFTQQIKTLQQAIALFGVPTIRALVINYGIQKIHIAEPLVYGIDMEQLSKLNMEQATFAASWMSKLDKALIDDIFLITLLSGMGKLPISKMLEKQDTALFQKAPTMLKLRLAEKKLVGYTTEAVSAMMYDYWRLDKTLIDVLEYTAGIGSHPKWIKKMAVILWIVKTALNSKERWSERSIAKALSIAERYRLPHLQESIDYHLNKH